jgi:hypothetical protein
MLLCEKYGKNTLIFRIGEMERKQEMPRREATPLGISQELELLHRLRGGSEDSRGDEEITACCFVRNIVKMC